MTDETSINFESLTFGLKEAQNARSCLEKDLKEKRQGRNQVEKTLDAVNGKLIQAKDIHAKMQETMKIAQHKVVQTQTLSESLESTNESKRESLTKLGEQIKAGEEEREKDMVKFEEELGNLSQLMRDAKTLYSDEKLDKDYDVSVTSEKELDKQGKIFDKEVHDLEKNLEELLQVNDKDPNSEDQLVYAEQILELFERAERDANEYLQQLDKLIAQTQSPLTQQQEVMD